MAEQAAKRDRPRDLPDLEIHIRGLANLGTAEAGYPVDLTLNGEVGFPRGHLAADIVPWVPSGDAEADGQRLSEAFLADPALRSA
jgi:hypothetical protein